MNKLVLLSSLLIVSSCGLKKPGQSRNVGIQIDIDDSKQGADASYQVDSASYGMRLMSFALSLETKNPKQQIFRDILTSNGEVEIEVPVGELNATAMMISMPIPQGTTFEQMCARHDDGPQQGSAPSAGAPSGTQGGGGSSDGGGDENDGRTEFLFFSASAQAVNVTKDTSVLQLSLPAIQRADFLPSGLRILRNGSPVQNAKVFLLEPVSGKKMLDPCDGKPVEYGRNASSPQGYLFDEVPSFPVAKVLVAADGTERAFEFVPSKTNLSANLLTLDIGTGALAGGPNADFDGDGVSNQQEISAQTDPMAGVVSLTATQSSSGVSVSSSNSRYRSFYCKSPGSTQFNYCGSSHESGVAQLYGLCGSGEFKILAAVTKDGGPNTDPTIVFQSAETTINISGGTSCSQGGGTTQAGGGTGDGGGGGYQPPPIEIRFSDIQYVDSTQCRLQQNMWENGGNTLTKYSLFRDATLLGTEVTAFTSNMGEKSFQMVLPSAALGNLGIPYKAVLEFTTPSSGLSTRDVVLNFSNGPRVDNWINTNMMSSVNTSNSMSAGMQPNFATAGCQLESFATDSSNTNTFPAQLAVGNRHACAITSGSSSNSTFRCWGSNHDYRAGVPLSPSLSFTPHTTAVFPSGGIHQLSSGLDHTCAIYGSNRNVSCWGVGSSGQMGTGTSVNAGFGADASLYNGGTPSSLANIAQLHSSANNTCALKNSGEIMCWGEKFQSTRDATFSSFHANELFYTLPGDATGIYPVQIAVMANTGSEPARVCFVSSHATEMNKVGRLFCLDAAQRTGIAATEYTYTPQGYSFPQQFRAVYAGIDNICALTTQGQVTCATPVAAFNKSQLGRGPSSNVPDGDKNIMLPVLEAANMPLMNVTSLSVSDKHACVLTKNPSSPLRCWGQNVSSILGLPLGMAEMPYANSIALSDPLGADFSVPIVLSTGPLNTCVGFFKKPAAGNSEVLYECIGDSTYGITSSTIGGEKENFIREWVAQPSSYPWAGKFSKVLSVYPAQPAP